MNSILMAAAAAERQRELREIARRDQQATLARCYARDRRISR